ncbi:MAG: NAD(P)/FAD-dependent oxidoreductase [Desulfovibrio sp.]|jgi:geranylgeranyl reductase family protein|nr:NAD(P)/FAD-dependent oxidoreductase [Desulfovibrio sp.]
MTELVCEIAVIGAGPAGSSAARAAAASGADVLLLERRSEIGVPVRCAEFIPAPLVGMVPKGDFIVQPIKGMRTFLNGEQIQHLDAPGFTICRDRFDKLLAADAVAAGARLLTGVFVAGRDGATLKACREDERISVRAAVVIGADGPHSRVARWMNSINSRCLPAVQMGVDLTRPLEETEFYFCEDIPGGYGWLFPKGRRANVGVGMTARKPSVLYAAIDNLLHLLSSQGKIFSVSRSLTGGGWVPAVAPRSIVRDNMLLTGDAAGYTHPITGGGVFQAVVGGGMAGNWAARALQAGNIKLLRAYEEEWNDYYGDTLAHAFQRRQLLEEHAGPLHDIIERCWIGFKDYYAES